jgi:hypothetical protein
MRLRSGLQRRPHREGETVDRMSGLNVLVITSYYWPEGARSGPYLTGIQSI